MILISASGRLNAGGAHNVWDLFKTGMNPPPAPLCMVFMKVMCTAGTVLMD